MWNSCRSEEFILVGAPLPPKMSGFVFKEVFSPSNLKRKYKRIQTGRREKLIVSIS